MLLSDEMRAAVVAHARFCLPEESCGLLATDAAGRLRFVYSLTNAAASPDRFVVDPVEHFGAMRHAERHGWFIGGVFHSHASSPAYPSPQDVAGSPGPDWVHLVVGPMEGSEPAVRAYRIVSGLVEEIELIRG